MSHTLPNRAICKADAEMPCGPLLFVRHGKWFVMKDDPEFRYEYKNIKGDEGWVFWRAR